MPICKDINAIILDYVVGDKAYWRRKFDMVILRLTVASPRFLFKYRTGEPDVFTIEYFTISA